MKKLAFAAAALAAGVAMADGSIQSANVVGYQQKELSYNENSFVTMTLMPVGKEMADVKLSDFVPTGGKDGWMYNTDYVATLKPNGAVDKKYGYISPYWANESTDLTTEGWHLYKNLAAENYYGDRCDDDTIPFGTGVAVYTGKKDVTLTFSGEVLADDYGIPLSYNANTFTGVICPADITLGKLEPTGGVNGWMYNTDYVATLKWNGACDKKYGYISPYWANESGVLTTEGWHDFATLQKENYFGERFDDVELKAGQALVVYTGKKDIELVVPSALP